jgi:putative membrane protein
MHSVDEKFKLELSAHIEAIEKTTSVEFVPVLIKTSSDYFYLRMIYLLGITLLGEIVYRVYLFPLFSYILVLCALLFVFHFLFQHPVVLSKLLPSKLAHEKVERAATLAFLQNEVFATRDRTGVMIFISELERAVFVLADKGLLKSFSEDYWKELGQSLASDFNADTPGLSFFAALDKMAPDLVRAFPPHEDNLNELPNTLR